MGMLNNIKAEKIGPAHNGLYGGFKGRRLRALYWVYLTWSREPDLLNPSSPDYIPFN